MKANGMTSLDVAVLRCMEICAEYRWLPEPAQAIGLIRLRDEVRSGRRSEHDLDDGADRERARRRLEWARWLVQHRLLHED